MYHIDLATALEIPVVVIKKKTALIFTGKLSRKKVLISWEINKILNKTYHGMCYKGDQEYIEI
jgi:hypothetical protein